MKGRSGGSGVNLVTGAGGSIGSALAHRLDHPVMLDRCESALYAVSLDVPGDLRLANIVNRRAMRRIVAETEPEVIYHAAACKHVPLMESNVSEAVQVNIGGTISLLDAAEAAGVPRFVLVSSDKAVEPASVMGATKRIAEWLVADRAKRTGLPYVSVRFGNVAGTDGSVIPRFRGQLERGEPLTITHPDATRYFMSLDEATELILKAGTLGIGGETFVREMGEPVCILDLARSLADEAGVTPTFVYTGLRPGEKLHERLYHPTETVRRMGGNLTAATGDEGPTGIGVLVLALLRLADGENDERLRAALFALVTDAVVESRVA